MVKKKFVYLNTKERKLEDEIEAYTNTDPRFKSFSACVRHLLSLGFKADRENRKKALKGIK